MAQRSYGFHVDRGWSAWLGHLGKGFHLCCWRAKRYDGQRSFLLFRIAFGKVSAHISLVKYYEGASLPWHFDAEKGWHRAIIAVMKPAKRGGTLEVQGKPDVHTARFSIFDGRHCKHRLTTIEEGTRWIIMIQANAC